MAVGDFGYLELKKRRALFQLKEALVSVAEIASYLGRYSSTIYCKVVPGAVRQRK